MSIPVRRLLVFRQHEHLICSVCEDALRIDSREIEEFGLAVSRPRDWKGIGYFYNRLSGPLEGLAAPIAALQDVHGREVYYNAEVTPWLHLTTDLLAIRPELDPRDTALVPEMRAKIDY